MTADEIRKMVDQCDQIVKSAPFRQRRELSIIIVSGVALKMAGEIAAQLAELNEARKPRWVWLKFCGEPFVIDANEVSGVAASFPNAGTISIGMKGQPWSKSADGTVADVCRKLGIPMEGE